MSVASIPITGRPAMVLAHWYGYDSKDSLRDLASELPPSSLVADVGAGTSDLGLQVCRLRDDVTWHNIDVAYQNPELLRMVRRGVPDNLRFIPKSVHEIPDPEIEAGIYQRVFSYWLVPHLLKQDYEKGVRSIRNMLRLLDSAGVLRIGPAWRENGHTLGTIAIDVPPTGVGLSTAAEITACRVYG